MCVKFGASYRGLQWQVLVRYRVAIQRETQDVPVFPVGYRPDIEPGPATAILDN